MRDRSRIRPLALPLGLLVGAWLALPSMAAGQGFEGVIKQRTISLDGEAIWRVIDSLQSPEDEESDEPTEAQQRQYMREMAAKVLALPIDELLSLAGPGRGMGELETDELTIYLKGPRIRMEGTGDTGGFAYVLASADEAALTMVNPGGKFYVKWSAEAMKQAMAGMGLDTEDAAAAPREETAPPKVRSLGETKEVNGLRCEAYAVESEDRLTIGCVTDSYRELRTSIESLAKRMQSLGGDDESDADSDVEDVLWEKGVPVLIQTIHFYTDEYSGVPSLSRYEIEEIVSVESKGLSSDLFEVPAGYTEKSLSALWGQG